MLPRQEGHHSLKPPHPPMPRSSWKGFIRVSLVSIPVEGYTASSASTSQISLNQLHQDCGERIRYIKTCPVHGEVSSDQIVMGYQYERDHYALVDPAEIDELRSEADRSINVDRFVDPSEVDPRYFAGKTYYLLPSGNPGQKPYALLHRAIVDAGVVGLAQVVISNREQLVMLRPIGKLLSASILQYAADVKPIDEFEKLLSDEPVAAQELKLAKTLIAATREKDAELDSYHDLYAERLRELVDAKMEGKEIAKPTSGGKAPPTINIMDALKASLEFKKVRAGAKSSASAAGAKRPAKPRTTATPKKRKTG